MTTVVKSPAPVIAALWVGIFFCRIRSLVIGVALLVGVHKSCAVEDDRAAIKVEITKSPSGMMRQ